MRCNLSSHGRALVLGAWMTALSWCLPAAAQALSVASVETSIAEGVRSYDVASIGWGVLVALVGGCGRTVLSLLTPNVVVLRVLKETWRDLLIAALAGCAASLVLQAVQALLHEWRIHIPPPVIVLILAACGWARMAAFVWAERSGRYLADRSVSWLGNRLSSVEPTYPEPLPSLTTPEDNRHG